MPNSTQTHGFWALIWNRANGGDLSSPATSPLPLMRAPGLLTYMTLSEGLPAFIQSACQGTNTSACSRGQRVPATAAADDSTVSAGFIRRTRFTRSWRTASSRQSTKHTEERRSVFRRPNSRRSLSAIRSLRSERGRYTHGTSRRRVNKLASTAFARRTG
jgi:hypothetical protein